METNQFRSLSLFLICSFCIGLPLWAQNQTVQFTYQKNQLQIENKSGYDYITYADFELSRQVGAPQLPMQIARIIVPARKAVTGVKIINMQTEMLAGEYHPFPAQAPQVLSDNNYVFAPPDAEAYSVNRFFPQEVVRIAPTGSFSGENIAGLVISPVQYLAPEKKLRFISKLEVELLLEDSQKPQNRKQNTSYSQFIRNKALKKLVKNSKQLATDFETIEMQTLAEEYRYVIITSQSLVGNFQPLADWKLKKGLSAKIITTDWIYTAYSGKDSQEKIRNFIIDAWQNWGAVWVLLGGDTNVIPHRTAFAFDCKYGDYSENYIPCDLYYADLDGNWNANGNNIYGEVDDGIDMYPDVFVGRAPVESAEEANNFVNKILSYEKSGLNDRELKMLFLADILWNSPYTNSGDGKDYIDEAFVPQRFDPIEKLYAHNGNESISSVLNAMNQGYHLINHDGHAFTSVMGVGSGYLGTADMDDLTNGSTYSILFSIGCWPASFDYDCIAEHFVTNPNGGGVAFIGNSRYGWGSPGNPRYGYSDRFDQQFFKSLFVDNQYHLGQALSKAKMVYVPYAAQENVYRWCEYQVNLLGDPELPVWTETPSRLAVEHPISLPLGQTQCAITVTTDDGQPVPEAMVCLMQTDSVYQTALTGLDGTARLTIAAVNPSPDLQITVTAQNAFPYENTISLFSEKPYVGIAGLNTKDLGDNFVRPDALVSIGCWFKNYGNQPAVDVTASLGSSDPQIILEDKSAIVGTIQPGDSVYIVSAFSLNIGSNFVNGEVIYLDAQITDNSTEVWNDKFGLIAATPILEYGFYLMSDSLDGDSDNFAEPGETVAISIAIQNAGLAAAQMTTAQVNADNPDLTLPDGVFNLGTILPDGAAKFSFEMPISDDCATPSFVPLTIAGTTTDGYPLADTFHVSIGEFGFIDDMEINDSRWSHEGTPDLWHRTTVRKHSGYFSWYCGDRNTRQYENEMENSLLSQKFVIDENSELSFWCWYEYPNYGVNGLYPEANDGSGWQELDFIGSGGALGILPTRNDWLEYTYDLSAYPPGSILQLRFRFISDNEQITEGVYLDDVVVKNKLRGVAVRLPQIPATPGHLLSEVDNGIKLSWESQAAEIEGFNQDGYTFQGYNIYQLNSIFAGKSEALRLATFDVVDGVKEILDAVIDPETGERIILNYQYGSDSGIQRTFIVERDSAEKCNLVKGKPYYFAVTSYVYNLKETARPRFVESILQVMKITYHENEPGCAYGDTIQVKQIAGSGDGIILPIVQDPSLLTGHTYQISFDSRIKTRVVWNLTDLTLEKNLLSHQAFSDETSENPIVDGFQMIVKQPVLSDYSQVTTTGSGSYTILSPLKRGWSQSSRATDMTYYGSTDIVELQKDYEFRATGQLKSPDANQLVYVEEGTGSMAKISGANNYMLGMHPMNPNQNPLSNAPFMLRIPFEVWNIEDNQQVNILFVDYGQTVNSRPFYAFNPDFTVVYILNTPYSPENPEQGFNNLDHVTWVLTFRVLNYIMGDVIQVTYSNMLTKDDVYTFRTENPVNVGDETDKIPLEFGVFQNYPNPFNATTLIKFQLPENEPVTLKIYDILGREVRTLINSALEAGPHKIYWDGLNNSGQSVASGLYFYKLKSAGQQSIQKMVLIR